MTQSPVFPTVMPNLEFIEHYIDSLENLPLDVQRHVSQIREYDYLYSNKLQTISRYLCLYQKESNGPLKRKYLNKIQKCLIRSQQYADEKLCLISQIVELVDGRSQQLSKDVEILSHDQKEEEDPRNSNSINNSTQNRVKISEKKQTIMEKPVRDSIYVKPKRVRRVRAPDKVADKSDRLSNRANNRAEYEDEDEPMEEEEDIEIKPRKDSKKKDRDSKVTREKEKEKEATIKEEKEDRKETENSNNNNSNKKNDRKEKSSAGKVTKKTSNAKPSNSKIKKKKKKEKEVLPEDIPVDPDEPTYCICNRISYGDMIGCDNQDCKIEWFHFDCLNLTHKPKGKWYCPQCTVERKEKGKK